MQRKGKKSSLKTFFSFEAQWVYFLELFNTAVIWVSFVMTNTSLCLYSLLYRSLIISYTSKSHISGYYSYYKMHRSTLIKTNLWALGGCKTKKKSTFLKSSYPENGPLSFAAKKKKKKIINSRTTNTSHNPKRPSPKRLNGPLPKQFSLRE